MKKFFTLIAMMFVTGAAMYAQDWGDNEFANSDLEAEAEYPWFHVKSNLDNPEGAITTAIPEAGIGVNGSKGIKVVAKGGASADWDSQFWIQIPTDIANGVLEFGEQVLISFDYRAEWEIPEGDEEVESITIGTQGHNEPGSYRNNTGVGNVEFKSEWSHHEGALAPDANPYSIAFNLCQNHHAYDATFYFDNITIQRVKKNEEIIQYWAKLVTNGDFESDNTDSYVVRIYQQGDKAPEIVEGEGVDDSRAIKVVIPAKQENDWDSQFFIKLKEPLDEGQAFKVSMDIRASEAPANNPETQSHVTPGDYIYWSCIGTPTFTTEWTTYERTVTVSSDMVTNNGHKDFQTIAFNMSRNDHEITYWFDNINIRILKEGSLGDVPELIELQETIDGAEAIDGSAPANAEIRATFTAALENAQAIIDAVDSENAEKAMYTLISAQSKLVASINDYKNLNSFIAWVEGKQAIATQMGEHYADLADQLDALTGSLHDQVNLEAWTKAEINENTSKSAIKTLIAQYIAENVQDGDDITIMMENPDFAGNTSGWDRNGGSKFLDYGPANRNTLTLDTDGGYLPTGMAEVWHGSYDAYQTLPGLPAGLYTLTVNACQRADEDTDETAYLYGIVNGAETHKLVMSVYADPAPEMLFDSDADPKWPSIENPEGEGWIPNGKGSANYHLNGGFYLNTLNILVPEGGDLRVGVKDANTTAWIVVDNFKVTYHSLDNKIALGAALESLIASANEMKEGLTYPAQDAIYESIKGAEAVVETIEGASKEDVQTAYDALAAAIDDAVANAKAQKDCETYYYETFSGIYAECGETAMPAVIARATAADEKYDTVLELTTAELNAYLAEMKYLCDALLVPAEAATASDANAIDLTEAVLVQKGVDVDFEDFSAVGANANYPGWSGSGFGTGGGTAGPVGERWNQTNGFDTYTVVKGLPEGIYELVCDGGYRIGGAGSINDYNLAQADTINANVPYMYATTSAGTAKTYLPNVYSVLVTEEIAAEKGLDFASGDNAVITVTLDTLGNTAKYLSPQQLYTADLFMQAGFYNGNKVTFKVGADGEARIGVKKDKGASNDWTFVDNIKLIYYGSESSKTPDALDKVAVAPAVKAIYTISGLRVNNMNKAGLYIVNGKKVLVK